MNKLILCLVGILISSVAIGQSEEDLEFLRNFKNLTETIEEKKYTDIIDLIIRRAKDDQDLATKYAELIKKRISESSDLNDLADKINPSSTALTGKSYNDFIRDRAKSILLDATSFEDFDGEKERLTSIIDNLTDSKFNEETSVVGGIVKTLLNSSPVTNIFNKVLGSVTSFFKAKKEKGKKRVEAIVTAFGAKSIEKFYNDLRPYVEFYDQSLTLNREFGRNIESLKVPVEKLNNQIKQEDSLLRKELLEIFEVTSLEDINSSTLKTKFPFDLTLWLKNEMPLEFRKLRDHSLAVEKLLEKGSLIEDETDRYLKDYLKATSNLEDDFRSKIKTEDGNDVPVERIKAHVNSFVAKNSLETDLNKMILKSNMAIEERQNLFSILSNPQGLVQEDRSEHEKNDILDLVAAVDFDTENVSIFRKERVFVPTLLSPGSEYRLPVAGPNRDPKLKYWLYILLGFIVAGSITAYISLEKKIKKLSLPRMEQNQEVPK